MPTQARSAGLPGATLLFLVICIVSSTAKGFGSRRALQQDVASATATGGAASAYASSSSSASSYSTQSGSSFLQSSVDALQFTTWAPQQQPEQHDSQQQQQQGSFSFGSLVDSVRSFFIGDNGQGAQPAQQQGDVQPQPPVQEISQTVPSQQQPTPAATSTTSSPTDSISAYGQQCLNLHNSRRGNHVDTPALSWSSQLQTDAQNWANTCARSHDPNNGGQGENIAWGYPDAQSVLDAYYAEGNGYPYGVSQPSDWHAVGHFTQMVWRSTSYLGCAVATCSDGTLFHVCRYSPPGNVQGQYKDNVMQLAA